MESNVAVLDDYRAVEEVVKLRLGAVNVVFCAELPEGEILTYIPHELLDINLVYMIQTLKDRRRLRLEE